MIELDCLECDAKSVSEVDRDVIVRDERFPEQPEFDAKLMKNGWTQGPGGDVCMKCHSSITERSMKVVN